MEKSMAEMRHEIIEKNIKLELMLDDIIKTAYGFEIKLQEVEDEFGEQDVIIENELQVSRFEKFFLERKNIEAKFNIVRDIIDGDKMSVSSDVWKDSKRLREIRNIFAHTLAPKYADGHQTLKTLALSFPNLKKNHNWIQLYEEFNLIFDNVYHKISDLFYVKVT